MIPDLRALYGTRFEVERDKTQEADEGPWKYYILGRRGEIVPWGPSLLAACISSRHPGIIQKLLRFPWVDRLHTQIRDDGANVAFPLAHFEDVVPLIKPYRVR